MPKRCPLPLKRGAYQLFIHGVAVKIELLDFRIIGGISVLVIEGFKHYENKFPFFKDLTSFSWKDGN